jgi:imidazolonepropionase-like amidohydrolase
MSVTRSLAVIVAATCATFAQTHEQSALALVGARIYPSPDAPPLPAAVVVIDSGRITAVGPRDKVVIPEGTRTLDCSGLTIVAGFQNSHVHFTDPTRWADASSKPATRLTADLQEMLTRYGFTTVVDTASDLANTSALRRRIESGDVHGPRILTAGSALYPADGVPYYVRDTVPADVVRMLPQPALPDDAARMVRSQLSAGADLVKLFTGSWVQRGVVKPMQLDIATAAVREAHRLGKPVFAHASNVAGLEVAIRSGLDVLAHPIDDTRGLTNGHLKQLISHRIAMVPTLALFRGDTDVVDEVRNFARRGGDILFGTDIGYLPDFDTAEEFRLMAAAGLGWREILASLTTTPARRFGEATARGRIAPGMAADLVVLAANPRADALEPESFARVRFTIRGGQLIYDASPADATITELKEMQQRGVRALLEGRREEYAALLAAEWRVTHIDGRVQTKTQVLEQMFPAGPSPLVDLAQDDIEVRIFGDSAVVTGRTTAHARDGRRVVLRFSDFVVKRNGVWTIVASHATQLREK